MSYFLASIMMLLELVKCSDNELVIKGKSCRLHSICCQESLFFPNLKDQLSYFSDLNTEYIVKSTSQYKRQSHPVAGQSLHNLTVAA